MRPSPPSRQASSRGPTTSSVRAAARLRARLGVVGWLLAVCVSGNLIWPPSAAGQGVDREYALKAVYLYKFATYVKWPPKAFANAASPFVIGILGQSPVTGNLQQIAAVKKVDGRPIEVREYRKPTDVAECHILFIPGSLDDETQQSAIKLLAGRNILFVGEDTDFLKFGGVFDFVVQDNRIRVYVSQPGYVRESLEISAQLLRVATLVE